MSDSIELFYWDACIFYEYLKGEAVPPLQRQAIEDCLLANKDKRNRICTSVITHVEVFPRKLGEGAEQLYNRNFGSMHFFDIALDKQVLSLAREIRDYYYVDGVPGKCMGLGDSIHLATAVVHSVDAFHTRDAKKKGSNVPLLGLCEGSPNGKLCGTYPLKIISPEAEQGRLFGGKVFTETKQSS